jgi:DNA-binding transcriptional MerR regulator
MKRFPIMLVEQFCEIKAHTIRMWELRYNFLKPQRTDTNLRSYSLTELRDLLNISLLNRNGFKISALARRSGEEIEALIRQQPDEVVHKQGLVNQLLLAMLEADIDSFTSLLSAAVQNWGINSVIKDVIYPFMQKAFYNN